MRRWRSTAVAGLALVLGLALAPAVRAQTCAAPKTAGVTATFLGVSSILFDDGEVQILTDGYFSRPRPSKWPFNLETDPKRVDDVLRRAGICRLKAVFVAHAHHDHVLDAPYIAKQTGALLVGSASVAAIAQGQARGLKPGQIAEIETGDSITCGRFKITAIKTPHAHGVLPTGDVVPPVGRTPWLFAYEAGSNFTFLVQHADTEPTLVIPSASPDINLPARTTADTVFLGVGLLGNTSEPEARQYWHRTVVGTSARRVIPVHWDNLSGDLSEPMKFAPEPFDHVSKALAWIDNYRQGQEVRRLPAFGSLTLKPRATSGPASLPAGGPLTCKITPRAAARL